MELWLSRKSPVSAQTEKNKPAKGTEIYKQINVLTWVKGVEGAVHECTVCIYGGVCVYIGGRYYSEGADA